MAYNFKDIKVLIVESSPPMRELLETVLTDFTVLPKNIFAANTMQQGFQMFCDENHDLVISDWMDDPTSGNQLTQQIRTSQLSPNAYVPILMTAGSGHKNKVMQARDMGVSGYLVKPFSAISLAQRIEIIIENPRPFIVHHNFVGPDRRIKQQEYGAPEKRKSAPEKPSSSGAAYG